MNQKTYFTVSISKGDEAFMWSLLVGDPARVSPSLGPSPAPEVERKPLQLTSATGSERSEELYTRQSDFCVLCAGFDYFCM